MALSLVKRLTYDKVLSNGTFTPLHGVFHLSKWGFLPIYRMKSMERQNRIHLSTLRKEGSPSKYCRNFSQPIRDLRRMYL
jgi:hypothetical protein